MIVQGERDSYDEPPKSPHFGAPAQRHRESVSSAISGAATAIKKALAATPPQKDSAPSVSSRAGVSPGKAIELRMKNYEYIQQLFDDSILSDEEYTEQKTDILNSLKRL